MQHTELIKLGWRPFFEEQVSTEVAGLIAARVSRQNLNRYHLLSAEGALTGLLPGKARASARGELPAVGDWVLCRPADAADPTTVIIERTLDRFSKFSRKEAGERIEEQILAANIDTVFIVSGLDDNFNPSRIERYLFIAWNSGANPVVVLNKADVATDLEEALAALSGVLMGAPVHAISALEGTGLEALADYVTEGKTVALLGSSGVGKSTTINALLGYQHFETGAVREGDSKGRHTTTHRELCTLAGGGLLIDTPGMREIQLWSDDTSNTTGFEDVEALAARCRFNDCRHNAEPGCAIRAAIETNELASGRLESYRKFQRELAHFAEKQDAGLRAERKQQWRKFSKSIRNRPTKRDM